MGNVYLSQNVIPIKIVKKVTYAHKENALRKAISMSAIKIMIADQHKNVGRENV